MLSQLPPNSQLTLIQKNLGVRSLFVLVCKQNRMCHLTTGSVRLSFQRQNTPGARIHPSLILNLFKEQTQIIKQLKLQQKKPQVHQSV